MAIVNMHVCGTGYRYSVVSYYISFFQGRGENGSRRSLNTPLQSAANVYTPVCTHEACIPVYSLRLATWTTLQVA